jgi:hypothetical protein
MNFIKKLFGDGLPADQTEDILGNHLDGDFRVYPMAKTPTSLAQIEALEQRFGVKYPRELAAHICGRFPGLILEVKEEIWPRPQAYDTGPFWSFLYGLHTFTSAPESEDWMRLDVAAETFQRETGLAAAPILQVIGDADVYCADAQGQIVRFDHETGELEAVGLNFWQLFEREVQELCVRKEKKKRGA